MSNRKSQKERETERDRICRSIRHYYNDLTRDRGYKAAALALGFPCAGTLINRLNKPADFRLGELQAIASTMNISLDELLNGRVAAYE